MEATLLQSSDMRTKVSTLSFLLLLIGCAAVNQTANTDSSAPAFINQTAAPAAVLMQQWVIAQHTISEKESDLNPVTRMLFPGTPMKIIPPDPRAMNVLPHGVKVVSVPDLPISQLSQRDGAWASHTDPSGVFDCGGNILAHACVDIRTNTVYAAASLVPGALEWEFENIILSCLGYDVSGR